MNVGLLRINDELTLPCVILFENPQEVLVYCQSRLVLANRTEEGFKLNKILVEFIMAPELEELLKESKLCIE